MSPNLHSCRNDDGTVEYLIESTLSLNSIVILVFFKIMKNLKSAFVVGANMWKNKPNVTDWVNDHLSAWLGTGTSIKMLQSYTILWALTSTLAETMPLYCFYYQRKPKGLRKTTHLLEVAHTWPIKNKFLYMHTHLTTLRKPPTYLTLCSILLVARWTRKSHLPVWHFVVHCW
jgi:hypothetical protein